MEQRQPAQDESIRPLRRTEYDILVQCGVFDGERLELLDGALVCMSPQGEDHAWTLMQLTRLLFERVGDAFDVRVQLPMAASEYSEPEPDLAILPRSKDRAHPETALLIIEVSESTLARDRGLKGRLYAAAGVPEYWVVNLVDRVLEVHTEPGAEGYGSVRVMRPGDDVRSDVLDQVFAVADVVPVAN